jgi:hypothetical protein
VSVARAVARADRRRSRVVKDSWPTGYQAQKKAAMRKLVEFLMSLLARVRRVVMRRRR